MASNNQKEFSYRNPKSSSLSSITTQSSSPSSSYSGTQEENESNVNQDKDKVTKTLKLLEFRNPGRSTELIVNGKRKPKSRAFSNMQNSQEKLWYNEYGQFNETQEDICDCLRANCPGCHFPCKQCGSEKCGNKCRVNRTWYYNKVEIEGLYKCLTMNIE